MVLKWLSAMVSRENCGCCVEFQAILGLLLCGAMSAVSFFFLGYCAHLTNAEAWPGTRTGRWSAGHAEAVFGRKISWLWLTEIHDELGWANWHPIWFASKLTSMTSMTSIMFGRYTAHFKVICGLDWMASNPSIAVSHALEWHDLCFRGMFPSIWLESSLHLHVYRYRLISLVWNVFLQT